ncbi:MAG: translation elongation factor 4 [Veillonella parvula]|nr:translation elongation factor 4 [Veillonella parvula]
MSTKKIRNFCIIAHIDHGKSTIADRLIEYTGTLQKREMEAQVLDSMDLERERGITIKAQSVRILYKAQDGEEYTLNLIDTPGHVDFSYEVSRSLAACEGALLVVDAAQGVEAQTLANVYLALEHDLEIIPVINKIDLPSAPTRALIFDSRFDAYKGAIAYVRVKEGSIKAKDTIRMMHDKKDFDVTELGIFTPNLVPVQELPCGSVGCIAASIKNVKDCHVGDTVTLANNPASEPLPGYRKAVSMVYCGLYPTESKDYENLRDALEKLQLNDAALEYEAETSLALGFGFRCGFLGLLHMDVIQERLEREYNLTLITTAPSVNYKVYKTNGEMLEVDNPAKLPPPTEIDYIEEPYVKATTIVPKDFVGTIMELSQDKRGEYQSMEYLDETRVSVVYHLPLSEIIYDYFDKLKSATKGYASLDYELIGYKQSPMVKMDILLNGDPVDALSIIVHKDRAATRGRALAEKLKELIPRQMFEIPIQAAVGTKIVARETVKAWRKDVLAKCYGGDISRKRKLLEKQKAGKKRMKSVGSVEIPQEAFMAILKVED